MTQSKMNRLVLVQKRRVTTLEAAAAVDRDLTWADSQRRLCAGEIDVERALETTRSADE